MDIQRSVRSNFAAKKSIRSEVIAWVAGCQIGGAKIFAPCLMATEKTRVQMRAPRTTDPANAKEFPKLELCAGKRGYIPHLALASS